MQAMLRACVDTLDKMARRPRFKVMWDYNAFPVWPMGRWWQPSAPVPSMSQDLRRELQAWSDERTTRALNDLDSYEPGDKDADEDPEWVATHQEWIDRGRKLAERLQAEVGDGYEIVYFNDETMQIEGE